MNLVKFNDYKLRITQFLTHIENDKAQQQMEKERQLEELSKLEKQAESRFAKEREALKETEKRLLGLIEEKFMTVRKNLSSESRERYESIESLKAALEHDLPRL